MHESIQTCPPSLLHSPRVILGCPTQVHQHKPGTLNRHRHAHVHRKKHAWGINMVSKRHAKASNPHTADYDPEKDNNYIMYYDENNLCGWAMSQPLPYSGFKWKEIKDGKFYFKKGKGYILEVDHIYPKHLHKSHND